MANNSFATFFGASYPAQNDVLDTAPTYGDSVNVLNGTFDPGAGAPNYPTEAEVLLGVVFGTLGSEEFTGNYRTNVVGDVRDGKVFGSLDSEVGVLDLPAVVNVRDGIFFDNNLQEGTLDVDAEANLPLEPQVLQDVTYGSSLQFTGTLDPGGGGEGIIPAPEDVRFGVPTGVTSGVLILPAEQTVLLSVGYGANGTEFTGTLDYIAGGTADVTPPVTPNGWLRSPLYIGDEYIAPTNPFLWTISPPAGMIAGTTVAKFRGRRKDSPTQDYEWEVTGTITDDTTTWDLSFDMEVEDTSPITTGEHDWFVLLEDAEGDPKTVMSSYDCGTVLWVHH